MATIANRLTQVHQYVWYGTCETEVCEDEIFEDWGTKAAEIEQNVIEISTYEEGVFKTYRPNQDYSSPMQPGEGELDRFKCGHMYAITLKKEGVIEMENMYPSNASSIQRKYGVSTTCAALGDGALSCIPDGYTAFYYKDQLSKTIDFDLTKGDDEDTSPYFLDDDVDNPVTVRRRIIRMTNEGGEKVLVEDEEADAQTYGTMMWNRGDARDVNSYIAIDLAPLQPFPEIGSNELLLTFHLKVGSGNNQRNLGFLTLQANPGQYQVFFYENGTCYSGFFADASERNSVSADLILTEEWASSTRCTYTDESDDPVVFELFEVDPNTTASGDIQFSNFSHTVDVRVPPVAQSSEEDTIINLYYYTDTNNAIGRITYAKSTYEHADKQPEEQTPFVYLFGRTGPFAEKCLFGVIIGNKCILGE